ncbi:hypothetical protein BTJ44_03479 [Bacillus mycoides]|nr:hypothetical protein BTJ44_03479 [Bacillus mycoides]
MFCERADLTTFIASTILRALVVGSLLVQRIVVQKEISLITST